MNIYDALFSSSFMLNEQIAREIFDILPEQAPLLLICDKDGNCWPSDQDKFDIFFHDMSQIEQICSVIDDGGDPVIGQIEDCGLVATELEAAGGHYGYLIMVLQHHTPESTLAAVDLIEMFLNQTNLVARLIEKNNQIHHQQLKNFSFESPKITESGR